MVLKQMILFHNTIMYRDIERNWFPAQRARRYMPSLVRLGIFLLSLPYVYVPYLR